jgi:hypothetical protein
MRLLIAATLLAACGDDGTTYNTFQACFDDLDKTQSRRVSITTCCLDHDIGGAMQACGSTATTCATYVSSNLATTSASMTEIIEACDEYEMQLGM